MADVPLLPSLVAVIVTVPPSATSVTSPLDDTVAIVGTLDVHATVRPVSVLPLASFSVTLSCTVPLAGTIVVAGETATEATGASVTVTVALPVLPSLLAVLVADPLATGTHTRDAGVARPPRHRSPGQGAAGRVLRGRSELYRLPDPEAGRRRRNRHRGHREGGHGDRCGAALAFARRRHRRRA